MERMLSKLLRLLSRSLKVKPRGRPISREGERSDPHAPDLVAHDFEVWHTYTTYYDGPIDDLTEVAERLVKQGVAYTAMLPDGRTIWRNEQNGAPPSFGVTIFKTIANDMRHAAQLIPGKNESGPKGFALEAWIRTAQFASAEEKLFGNDLGVTPPAVRAFLGACMLGDDEAGSFWIYPVLNLYESGVVIVHLVVLGVGPVSINTMIDNYINLFSHSFRSCLVSPSFAKLAPRASKIGYSSDLMIKNPFTRWYQGLEQDRFVDKITQTIKHDDFEWQLADLPSSVEGQGETLAGLAHAIFDVVGLLAGQRRRFTRRPWISLGRLVKGNYWIGRPYVHLIRYEAQEYAAAVNEIRHRNAFAQLIMKTTSAAHVDRLLAHLPQNMRIFEDANVYFTKGLGLFSWSGHGLSQYGEPLSDRNSYIIESQVKAEVVEHANMLAQALYEAADGAVDIDRVFDLRARLLRLQAALDTASPYGEVADLVHQALSEVGFYSRVERAKDRLGLREAKVSARDSRRDRSSQRALTLLFGVIAAPAMADAVIRPLWLWSGAGIPGPRELEPIFFVGVSVLTLLFLALVLLGTTHRR